MFQEVYPLTNKSRQILMDKNNCIYNFFSTYNSTKNNHISILLTDPKSMACDHYYPTNIILKLIATCYTLWYKLCDNA